MTTRFFFDKVEGSKAGGKSHYGIRKWQLPIILVVTDPDTRNRLSAFNAKYDPMKRPDPYYGAPVILNVLSPKADPGAVEDGSLVIGNMLLAAYSLGLGTSFQEETDGCLRFDL